MNRIVITEDSIRQYIAHEDGSKSMKFLGVDEFSKIFSKGLRISTGHIKQNGKYKLLKYDYYDNKHVYYYMFEEIKKTINWGTEKYLNFPIPERIWVVSFDTSRNFVDSRLYALNSHNNTIWKLPFPNMHADQRVCWGQLKMGEYKPEHIDAIDGTFFIAPFNSDLLPIDVSQYNKWLKVQSTIRTFSWKLLQKYYRHLMSLDDLLKDRSHRERLF